MGWVCPGDVRYINVTSVVKKCLEETTTNCAQIFGNQRINVNFLLKKELKHMMSTRFGTNIDVIRMVAKAIYFLNHFLSTFMSTNQLLLNQ